MISQSFDPSPLALKMRGKDDQAIKCKESRRYLRDISEYYYPNEFKFDLNEEELNIYMELYHSHVNQEGINHKNNFPIFHHNLQRLQDISDQVIKSDSVIHRTLYEPKLFIPKQSEHIIKLGRSNKEKQKNIDFYMKQLSTRFYKFRTGEAPRYGISNSFSFDFLRRQYKYEGWDEEFQAKYLIKEDIHFVDKETPLLRIPIYFVYNNEQYIEIYALSLYTLGQILNYLLKYPVWSERYEYYIKNYKLNLIDLNSMIIELYHQKIIELFSEIHIKPTFL